MSATVSRPTIAERLAHTLLAARPEQDATARAVARRMLVDIYGLCVAARSESYVRAAIASLDGHQGQCTLIGSSQGSSVEGAAFVNGIAAHGEDFDDTYEGGPVHAGVVIVPALLAVAERHALSGDDLVRGLAVGCELMCRLCAVAPTRVHKAGFHPTAIFGVMGAVAGIAAALRLDEQACVDAFGIAGSMAGGIIEYLADGAWTKRMHPGWAAQSACRAVRLAQGGFKGPATVFEGHHGLFHGFANTLEGNFDALMDGLGQRWVWTTIAFKPYACGTMAHPYIDCARELRHSGVKAADIVRIECETAEGIVHRLWEPLASKRQPPNAYAAKFSIPYAVASGFLFDDAGLNEYTEDMVRRPDVLALAGKVSYVVDPANPYPRQFTGHLKVTLADGQVREYRQGHFKGGAEHPLSDEEITQKFLANCRYGGVEGAAARELLRGVEALVDAPQVAVPACPGRPA